MSTAVFYVHQHNASSEEHQHDVGTMHNTQGTRRVLRINSVNTSLTRIKRVVYFFWNDDSAMEASEELSPVEATSYSDDAKEG
jgi:hypothetical protein